MAVTRTLNVVRITADNDTVAGPLNICGINYVAAASGASAQMKLTDTSGQLLWAANTLTHDVYDVDIRIPSNNTIHFDLAGTGTEVILYLE